MSVLGQQDRSISNGKIEYIGHDPFGKENSAVICAVTAQISMNNQSNRSSKVSASKRYQSGSGKYREMPLKPSPKGGSAKRSRKFTNAPKMNKNTRKNQEPQRKTPVKIIPLGGLNEIGKNFTVIECANDMFIIDCGLAFPDSEMLGVDIVIPDFS